MKGNAWHNRPVPQVGHGGLFLPSIVAEEEWDNATLDVRVNYHHNLADLQRAYSIEMEQLYHEFWGGM